MNTPENLEAERTVLGSMLIERTAIERGREILCPEDFNSDAHIMIFEGIIALALRNVPVEPITLARQLQARGFDDSGDGLVYLQDLMKVSSIVNFDHNCAVIRKASDRRRAMERAAEAFRILQDDPDGLAKNGASNGRYNIGEVVKPKHSGKGELPKIMQIGEFLASVGDPPPFLVEQILPEKQLILIAGKPKHGKSFLALDMADCISSGREVLGKYRVNRPGAVLYCCMKDSQYTLANRVLRRGIQREDRSQPLHCTVGRFQISSAEGMGALRDLVAPINPVCVILDTAAQALGIRDWSDRGELENKMQHLRDFSREVCTVILVCHNRKAEGSSGDEIAGSNAFTAAVDGWLSSNKKEEGPGGNMRVSYVMDGRDIRGNLSVEMDTHTYHFRALGEDEVSSQVQSGRKAGLQAVYLKIADVVKQCGGKATAAEMMDASGWSQSTTSRHIDEMTQARHLRRSEETRKPESGRGRPAPLYEIDPESDLYSFSSTPIGVNGMNTNINAQHAVFERETIPEHLTDFFGDDPGDPDERPLVDPWA